MISIKNKFIVILPPKTGSVSISDALIPYAEIGRINPQRMLDNKVDCFDYSDPFGGASKHTPLQQMFNQWSDKRFGKFDDYIKVGAVRNPWDRIVSFWKWKNKVLPNPITLEQFINTRPVMHKAMPMVNYFKVDGKIKVTSFIRMESMQDDFSAMADLIGIDPKELPHLNKSKHKDYHEYYTEETKNMVANLYKEDIETFKYTY